MVGGEVNETNLAVSDEQNLPANKIEKLKSKTKWKSGSLLSRGSTTERLGLRFVSTEISEEWSLSKDGAILFWTTKISIVNERRDVAVQRSSSRGEDILSPGQPSVFVFKRSFRRTS